MNVIFETLQFFAPMLAVSLAIALLFALLLQGHFAGDAGTSPGKLVRACAYFAVFSIFGLVVAFFLSMGITETNGVRTNSLVENFATPLIALLTAGVTYFANKEAPAAAGAPVPAGMVPAGVICFLLGAAICYKSFLLIVAHAQ